jgi:hypothetical protein
MPQFAVIPAKAGDLHRSLTHSEIIALKHVFARHDTRQLHADFTIQFHNHWYQLKEVQPTTLHRYATITIETRLDDSIHFYAHSKRLNVFLLPAKPQHVTAKQPVLLTEHKLQYKPPVNHPWRSFSLKHH